MRVVDSSSLVKFFSREEGWDRVKEIMLQGVVTLDLAIKEVASALWKKVARNEMTYDTATVTLRDLLEEKAIPVFSQDRYLIQAFQIALNENITIYDALFIALAKELKAELIMSDKRQMDIAIKNGVKVVFID